MRKTNSTNFENESQLLQACPIYRATRLITGRWRTHILWLLDRGPLRFSQICDSIPLATERMIALRLRELMEDDLVEAVEEGDLKNYRLTAQGSRLIPVLRHLISVGQEHVEVTHL